MTKIGFISVNTSDSLRGDNSIVTERYKTYTGFYGSKVASLYAILDQGLSLRAYTPNG